MTATSVGITARVLSDIGKLDTPEGVTILAGAVVDDVLGIIILAIVVGIGQEGAITAGSIASYSPKAVGFWLGLTIIGSLLANHISKVVFWFKSPGAVLGIAMALGLLAAGVAEVYFGLAMIIGSYSLGLALSGTDLKHLVARPMRQINYFVVPAFFVVIGMQVDFTASAARDRSIRWQGAGVCGRALRIGRYKQAGGIRNPGAVRWLQPDRVMASGAGDATAGRGRADRGRHWARQRRNRPRRVRRGHRHDGRYDRHSAAPAGPRVQGRQRPAVSRIDDLADRPPG